MRTNITQPGSIDSSIGSLGDIQPGFLPLPDCTLPEPGGLPVSRHAAPDLGAAQNGPADGAFVASSDQSLAVTTAAGAAGGGTTTSGAATTPAPLALTAKSSGLVTYAPLVITPEFGSSITGLTGTGADPTTAAAVEAAIEAAIDYYDTNWTSSVPVGTVINGTTINTVNIAIEFDYGTLDGQAMSGSGASQSQYGLITIGNGSYATLYSTLSGRLPDLPATDPTGGSGVFMVTQAQSQLLGTGASVADPAGWVGLNSIKNGVTLNYNLANQSIAGEVGAVGAIEHEISETFGRTSDLGLFQANTYTLFDLYRFKAAHTPALTAASADYFSLNNGTTVLGYFDNHALNGGDPGDWVSAGPRKVAGDAFDAFLSTGTGGTISNLDSLVLGAIGLQQAPRTLVWTGGSGTGFGTAASWDDVTGGLNPAHAAPGPIDTAQFLGGGGTIAGSGTVATLLFGGTTQWDVAASLSAQSNVTVAGAVLINGGGSINGLGASDSISSPAGAGGASVVVDGIGSAWRSSGQLIIGDSATGSLTASNGGSVGAVATALLPAMVLGAVSGGTARLR